jgi:integrase
VAALTQLRKRQARESEDAGTAYGAGLDDRDWYTEGDKYVVGHTTLSLLEKAGVPISIISKWAGHYDSSFTMKTYVHATDDDLKQGRQALAKIHLII